MELYCITICVYMCMCVYVGLAICTIYMFNMELHCTCCIFTDFGLYQFKLTVCNINIASPDTLCLAWPCYTVPVPYTQCPVAGWYSVSVDWDPGCVATVRSVCSLDLAISTIYMIWSCTVLLYVCICRPGYLHYIHDIYLLWNCTVHAVYVDPYNFTLTVCNIAWSDTCHEEVVSGLTLLCCTCPLYPTPCDRLIQSSGVVWCTLCILWLYGIQHKHIGRAG